MSASVGTGDGRGEGARVGSGLGEGEGRGEGAGLGEGEGPGVGAGLGAGDGVSEGPGVGAGDGGRVGYSRCCSTEMVDTWGGGRWGALFLLVAGIIGTVVTARVLLGGCMFQQKVPERTTED